MQLRKPPAQRIYPPGFLQNITKYLEALSPIVETSITANDMSKLARVQRRLIQRLPANQCKITNFYSRVAQIFGEAKGMAAIDDADMDEPELELDEVHDGEVCDDDRPENHIDQ